MCEGIPDGRSADTTLSSFPVTFPPPPASPPCLTSEAHFHFTVALLLFPFRLSPIIYSSSTWVTVGSMSGPNTYTVQTYPDLKLPSRVDLTCML
jgi:hypothetical protein